MRLGSDGAIALVDSNLQHALTDLHLSKLTTTVLTFRDVSIFSSVNTANYSVTTG